MITLEITPERSIELLHLLLEDRPLPCFLMWLLVFTDIWLKLRCTNGHKFTQVNESTSPRIFRSTTHVLGRARCITPCLWLLWLPIYHRTASAIVKHTSQPVNWNFEIKWHWRCYSWGKKSPETSTSDEIRRRSPMMKTIGKKKTAIDWIWTMHSRSCRSIKRRHKVPNYS